MAFEDAQFVNFTNESGEPINDTNLMNIQKWALMNAHPVGSYYWSEDDTNPSRLFGGTWERVKDVFLYALGDTGNAGDTGGAATVVLSKANLPSINGSFTMHGGGSSTNISSVSGDFTTDYNNTKYKTGGTETSGANSVGNVKLVIGSNTPHNNMPPYVKAYCWKRTA